MINLKSKMDIRREVFGQRKNLLKDNAIQKSIEITNRIICMNEFLTSSIIMAYMDFNNEVMTGFLIDHCFRMGKRLVLPLVDDQDGTKIIKACEVRDLENDLKPGCYGILEPLKDNTIEVDPKLIDMVVVPGVAFDIKRNRIGYGAGYYDNFLIKLKKGCYKVGVAFEFQIYNDIPIENHDIPLDIIVTETGTF